MSCDLSEGAVVMGSGVVNGDVVRYRGEVISAGGSVKEIQYSCTVDYGSDVVIKSEVAKIFIVGKDLKIKNADLTFKIESYKLC